MEHTFAGRRPEKLLRQNTPSKTKYSFICIKVQDENKRIANFLQDTLQEDHSSFLGTRNGSEFFFSALNRVQLFIQHK